MPFLQAFNISHQFDNGQVLFEELSCSMKANRVGLIGRNGIGKSVLASILGGEIRPSDGQVKRTKSFGYYRQQQSDERFERMSIAQFLAVDDVLAALQKIGSGDCSQHLFDIVGDQWELPQQLAEQLVNMGLPSDPYFSCADLSGGQLARLQLSVLFEKDAELLILDEPSNHLDTAAKQWLIELMRKFSGAILLISHDRELLREMEEFWELSGLGLQLYHCDYDDYIVKKKADIQAIDRQLQAASKEKKRLGEQIQRDREKAEQRASQGSKRRKDGSQPKVLLDVKKDKATAQASSRKKNEQLRLKHLQDKEKTLSMRKETMKEQRFHFIDGQSRSVSAITIQDLVLPFGSTQPLSMQIKGDDKVQLVGRNGCGKSTLLKVLNGQLAHSRGGLQINSPLYYLDQHFSTISPELSMLDNLMHYCTGISEQDARTLLAGIGFRRDAVFKRGENLSGGEKMKLSVLIVSHQANKPMLLLDEPDNHLDLDSKDMLAQTLSTYQGGFILVSHDREFVEKSVCNRTLILQ